VQTTTALRVGLTYRDDLWTAFIANLHVHAVELQLGGNADASAVWSVPHTICHHLAHRKHKVLDNSPGQRHCPSPHRPTNVFHR
jgi:hypothetical protein